MKRTVSIALAAAAFGLATFGGARDASAYCVYNKSSSTVLVSMNPVLKSVFNLFFWPFNKAMAPGAVACCPWDDFGCNTAFFKHAPVQLRVRARTSAGEFRCGESEVTNISGMGNETGRAVWVDAAGAIVIRDSDRWLTYEGNTAPLVETTSYYDDRDPVTATCRTPY